MTAMRPLRDARAGMTLVELIIALTVFVVVVTTAAAFMARQHDHFQESIQRLVALRNLRYAVTNLSQDVETLGTNVPEAQPSLIYGDEDVIAFSADYATNVADDPFAVFYDPDAPSGQVAAPSGAVTIPNSGVSVADTAYESVPGVPSPAEVLLFFLVGDDTTDRTDDYVLYRQVNDAEPEPIARNLVRTGTTPFFSYEYLADDGTGGRTLGAVPDSLLPLHHSAAIHLAPDDTGRSALADSVRGLRVRLAATNGLEGELEERVELDRFIALPNAGFGVLATCGSAPILGVGLSATAGTASTGEPVVDLTWGPATDEGGGEEDVVRYVLWRRETGSPGWGDPYLAIPAGSATYSYEDASVTSGDSYEYALAAQDCTPTLSALASAGPVIIP